MGKRPEHFDGSARGRKQYLLAEWCRRGSACERQAARGPIIAQWDVQMRKGVLASGSKWTDNAIGRLGQGGRVLYHEVMRFKTAKGKKLIQVLLLMSLHSDAAVRTRGSDVQAKG